MISLYENNPRWAEIEMQVYGWLPTLTYPLEDRQIRVGARD